MFLREHNRKTNSKYYAHSFCIRQMYSWRNI
ncbi:zinc-finger domain-containing protein [Bacillus cereus]